MFNRMIIKYINNLKKEDIIEFSKSENINLNDKEIDIIYNTIKKDYKILLYGNSDDIFNNLKDKINNDSYNKIKKLYEFYKNKYKNYL